MAKEVYAALRKAQAEMGPLLKDATNPHYRSKYSTLATVIETIAEPLQNNGLVVIQTTRVREDKTPVLVTILAHESGDSIEGEYPLRAKDLDDPQKLGAAMTYARRYALMAMVGLAPEDDDGNLASGKGDAGASARVTGARTTTAARTSADGKPVYKASPNKPPSPAQKSLVSALVVQKLGVSDKDKAAFAQAVKSLVGKDLDALSSADASDIIERLKGMPDAGAGDADEPGF